MTLTLKSAITATQTTIDVDGTDVLNNGDLYAIEDEQIFIVSDSVGDTQPGQTAWQRLTVQRGVLGTNEASHAAATAVTPVTTPLSAGGGENPDGFTNDATSDFGFNSLTASGANSGNQLLATGTEASNLLRADDEYGFNHLWVRGVSGQNTLSANNDTGAAGIPLHLRRIGTTGPSGEASVLVGNVDPSAGGGVASAHLGSLYIRVDVPQLWIKTGAGDTAWQQLAFVP